MNTTVICWIGNSAILATAFALIATDHSRIGIAVSVVGSIAWGIFTGAKGWGYFGRKR